MSSSTTFAEDLRAWRRRRGIMQTEAAGWLRVALRTYEDWEQGRFEPSQPDLVRLLLELSDGISTRRLTASPQPARPPRRRRANQS